VNKEIVMLVMHRLVKRNSAAMTAGGALLLLAFLTGCSSGPKGLNIPDEGTGPEGETVTPDGGGGGGGTTGGVCTELGRGYISFEGQKLEADRVDANAGVDRARMKPYSALLTEYPRVLGAAAPASLADDGATFDEPVKRWFTEPQASAVSIFAAYSVAFEGCMTSMKGQAKYTTAPTTTTAATECAAMQRKFWSRTPSPEETSACVTLASTGLASEPDALHKWVHTCASVMTSGGFVTF
jgi:hypothetical protein